MGIFTTEKKFIDIQGREIIFRRLDSVPDSTPVNAIDYNPHNNVIERKYEIEVNSSILIDEEDKKYLHAKTQSTFKHTLIGMIAILPVEINENDFDIDNIPYQIQVSNQNGGAFLFMQFKDYATAKEVHDLFIF